jgi:hypothetical protein
MNLDTTSTLFASSPPPVATIDREQIEDLMGGSQAGVEDENELATGELQLAQQDETEDMSMEQGSYVSDAPNLEGKRVKVCTHLLFRLASHSSWYGPLSFPGILTTFFWMV